MKGDEAVNFFPFLWAEYDLEDRSRKAVPIQEMWTIKTGIEK